MTRAEIIEAVARAVFASRHSFESWDDFDVRKEARGGPHPMQQACAEDAQAAITAFLAAVREPSGVDAVWDALKRQCAATKPGSTDWRKVARLVMVSRDDVTAMLDALAQEIETGGGE